MSGKEKTREKTLNEKDRSKMEFINNHRTILIRDIATRYDYKEVEKTSKRIAAAVTKILGGKPMGLIALSYEYLVDLMLMEMIEEVKLPFPPMKINLPPMPEKKQ